ncbi:MAG: cytochrome c peroxidase, partial [Saprospiraceae bacterium]
FRWRDVFNSCLRSLPLLLFFSLLIADPIDLENLLNYRNDSNIPDYIIGENTPANNAINDAEATLGRVLFYDKKLSVNGSTACASCHHQEFAFGDTSVVSVGFDGRLTDRHSMRLVNLRFDGGQALFWNRRTPTLEQQTSLPIRDHKEMGFSGLDGQPGFDSLVTRLENLDYYQQLFSYFYGDTRVTERRIKNALAQFIRSIHSYDSKYDIGLAQVQHSGQSFPNFTEQENMGKNVFAAPPNGGIGGIGAGCERCHTQPKFDINRNVGNNNIITVAGDSTQIDLQNRRAPTLRDLVNPQGAMNGPFMHNGSLKNLQEVVEHYNLISFDPARNPLLDNRLKPNSTGQDLQMSDERKAALIAFLKTLTGEELYTHPKWSDPFNADGSIEIIPMLNTATQQKTADLVWSVYPNPIRSAAQIIAPEGNYTLQIFNTNGQLLQSQVVQNKSTFTIKNQPNGTYYLQLIDNKNARTKAIQIVKI